MYRLTLHLSGRPIQSFHFDQEQIHIGRDPECEIQIDNIGVSRQHATIELKDGEYVLTDLRSHNGTFVQGRRVYSHKLMENEIELRPILDRASQFGRDVVQNDPRNGHSLHSNGVSKPLERWIQFEKRDPFDHVIALGERTRL